MDYSSESDYSSDDETFYKDEMIKFKRMYKVVGLLRRSSHAEIYLGRYRKNQTQVIMKIIKKKGNWCSEIQSHKLASEVDNSGTAILLGVFERLDDIILVIEKPSNSMDILDIVNQYGPINLAMVKKIIHQIAKSCVLYKNAGIIHCDIKDENVMLDPFTCQTKIIDFGNSKLYGDGTIDSGSFGTLEFYPPECLTKSQVKCDPATVYSIGCLAFIMLTGSCPFVSNQIFDFQKHILFNKSLNLLEIKLLRKLLHPDPLMRETLESI